MDKKDIVEVEATEVVAAELSAEELAAANGGAEGSCTVKVDSKGNSSVECKATWTF